MMNSKAPDELTFCKPLTSELVLQLLQSYNSLGEIETLLPLLLFFPTLLSMMSS
jgi:hypothetical protein